MHRKNRRKAFTLIELLVVIAIIAILAAILFPVFAQARESARTTSCLNNEKQITLGILQYVQDYDEHFPYFYYQDPSVPGYNQKDPDGGGFLLIYWTWDKEIAPYIKNRGVFQCPDEYGPGAQWANTGTNNSDATGVINYATNCRLVGGDWDANWGAPVKLATLQYPAMSIMIRETGTESSAGACGADDTNGAWGWTNDQASDLVNQPYSGSTPAALVMHKGGANYAFCDGHAKWYNGSSMGLLGNGTSNDTYVNQVMDASGNHPTYHLSTTN